jgi:hypothetical protein
VIQRVPAITLTAFSAIVVATPIAMLLNAFVIPHESATVRSAPPPILAPVALTNSSGSGAAGSIRPTDDGGDPVKEEVGEKTE